MLLLKPDLRLKKARMLFDGLCKRNSTKSIALEEVVAITLAVGSISK